MDICLHQEGLFKQQNEIFLFSNEKNRKLLIIQSLREIHKAEKKSISSKLKLSKNLKRKTNKTSAKNLENYSGKGLKSIPSDLFTDKTIIKEFDFSNNQIQTITTDLLLSKRVNLINNPLLGVPIKYRQAPWQKVRDYLSKISKMSEQWPVRKLILLGDKNQVRSL